MQRWKTDPTLRNCPRLKVGDQTKKQMDYENVYIEEFLNQDPLRDWESIDRCKWLFDWALHRISEYEEQFHLIPTYQKMRILDCGTKDGQFPAWLREEGFEQSMGTEISGPYVDYAKNLGRPVVYGDICNMDVSWTSNFDFVFAHHVLGLTPDYLKALEEMYRVTSQYMIALNDVPGNKQKHYSYIDSPAIFHKFIEDNPCEVLWNNYLETGYGNEWVIFLRKV
jgi:hypothetical protein